MKKIDILLVEDDKDDYDFFILALNSIENIDYSLTWKKDGVEALQYLNSLDSKPDLVVLDLNMPKKNGFDTLQEIRKNEKFKDVRINIFTTSFSNSHLEYCKKLGCNGYYTKAPSIAELKASVQSMLNGFY